MSGNYSTREHYRKMLNFSSIFSCYLIFDDPQLIQINSAENLYILGFVNYIWYIMLAHTTLLA